jgi:hypothetical protein
MYFSIIIMLLNLCVFNETDLLNTVLFSFGALLMFPQNGSEKCGTFRLSSESGLMRNPELPVSGYFVAKCYHFVT